MISIIICSISKSFALQVQQNIADTIGVEWEPVIIDNTIVPKSITQVYNEGAAKARYDILCFVHEDILFQTAGWGKKIVAAFEADQTLGLIGVAGCKYKSKSPAGWFTGIPSFDCGNIKHFNRDGVTETLYFNPEPGSLQQQVVVMDGVFLCSPRRVWQQVRFDEALLKGFHLYDIDYSVRLTAAGFTAMVTFEIDMLHITKGNHFDNRWLDYTLRWHRHCSNLLPAMLNANQVNKTVTETTIVKAWLIRLKHEKLSMRNKMRWLLAVKIWLHPAAWINVPLFIVNSLIPKKHVPALGK